ncbi:MAG: efflux RND transporter periplasmic adaptor subunit [Verrucomicrobiota bacterium]
MIKPATLRAIVLSAAVLVAGAVLAVILIATAPQTQPEEKSRPARLVQTIEVRPRTESIKVRAEGTVVPARRVTMQPQVSGRVIWQHPSLVEGGYVKEGEELIQIDRADYELALAEQEAALEEAQFELTLEKGRQVVAAREWGLLEKELSDGEVNRALVLREPHLERTEALVRRATNEIAKAKLDLTRTSIRAPFNAMILSEAVEIGQLVAPSTAICTLVGTDEFWVQASLPVGELKWVELPRQGQSGSAARIVLDAGNGKPIHWDGRVVRLLADLEPSARMARVVVSVPNPLERSSSTGSLPLLLGSYVRVEIDAGELREVLVIPRAALREGNRLWVVNAQKELQVRDAEILWTRPESLLIANCILPGEQLIVSGLRVALPGMKVEPRLMSASDVAQAMNGAGSAGD